MLLSLSAFVRFLLKKLLACFMLRLLHTHNFNALSLLTYLSLQFPVSDVHGRSVFCIFGMAWTRPLLTMQPTSGMDVFAHCVRAKGGQLL